MALLDLIQNIFSGPKAQHDAEVQTQETSGLSSVDRYLEKQAMAAKEKAEAAAKQATGVERYLQKQALAAKEKAGTEAEAEAEAAVPATGVEKYLARQKGGAVKEKAAAAAPAAPVPVTGVDKYLAKKGTASHNPIVVSKPTPAPTTEPAAAKAAEAAKTTTAVKEAEPTPKETVTAAKKPALASKETATAGKKPTAANKPAAASSEKTEEAKSKTGGILKLSENATQCQARTAKGTQCKNTTHLTHIHRTINKQQYEFSVCTQHHTPSFKPYPGLIEDA